TCLSSSSPPKRGSSASGSLKPLDSCLTSHAAVEKRLAGMTAVELYAQVSGIRSRPHSESLLNQPSISTSAAGSAALERTGTGQPPMLRAVGRWQLVGLSVNDVIGSGIYLLPAAAAALLGPASLWAVGGACGEPAGAVLRPGCQLFRPGRRQLPVCTRSVRAVCRFRSGLDVVADPRCECRRAEQRSG